MRLRIIEVAGVFGLVLLSAIPAFGRETSFANSDQSRLMKHLGPRDTLLPITSIQWGTPDRWSFTSRYVHHFYDRRKHLPRRDNLSVVLCPGTSGIRVGLGYYALFELEDKKELAFILESRAILLRTWGNPLATEADRTFAGIEIRGGAGPFFIVGAGWYYEISSSESSADSFAGVHFGVGM